VTFWLISLPLVILAGAIREWDEINRVLVTLRGAERGWLLVGTGISALLVLSPALTYRVILSRLGHVLPFPALVGMHLQRIVIGTLAPISGPVSAFAFVRALNRHSVATHDALTMLALRSVATQGAFVVLLLCTIALRGPIYALAVMAFVATVVFGVVPLARRASIPAWMGPWSWRRYLPQSLSTRVIEFAARFRRHQITASDLSRPLMITIATRFVGPLLLVVSIKAMGVEVAPKTIAMAILAEMAAKLAMPIFHGIGVVEAATAIALQQSGVPADAAVGAALLWRAFEFWLPFTAALLSQGGLVLATRFSRSLSVPEPRPGLLVPDVPALEQRRLGGRASALLDTVRIRRSVSGASEAS
jgi:uncharacterized membrane protein YbhN (UPF0104 family)